MAWAAAGSKPHVVFALTDDWGFELWPRDAAHTALLPHTRRLFVEQGVQLERHYAYSYCAPSRQSLLSGRLPINVNEDNSVCSGIPREMSTIADRLKAGGYATHFVGKWHAGFADASATPSRRGFGTSLGFFMKAHHHFSHCSYLGYEHALKRHAECRTAPSNRSEPLLDFFAGSDGVDRPLGRSHPAVAARTYSTELFTAAALDVIRAHDAATPLFLFLSFSAVHKPFLAPAALLQRATLAHEAGYFGAAKGCGWVAGSPVPCRAKHRKAYEAMAVGVDDAVGRLEAALRAKGAHVWERTLLVFASDNGGPIGPQASLLPTSLRPPGPGTGL